MILATLHPGDLVTAHGRYYRCLFVRGSWVTVRDVRGDTAQFNVKDVELAGALP